jgi:hypothetical protein
VLIEVPQCFARGAKAAIHGALDQPGRAGNSPRPTSRAGLLERLHEAYEQAIRATAAKHAPWYVVPADNKWYTRLVVSAAIVAAMERLELTYPKIDAAQRKELAAARAALAKE